MASNYQAPETTTDTSDSDSSAYLDLVGFWKETWFRAFVVVEIVLFGGGYVISRFGSEQPVQMGRQHPDVHYALGGVMGALGVLAAAVFLLVIATSIYLRLRKILEPDPEF